MRRHQDPRPIREQLAGAERGLQALEKTRNRDDQRVMLGCLLFDLVAIEKAMARDGCTTEEGAQLATLGRRAWEIQRQIGSPISDPSEPIRPPRMVRRRSPSPTRRPAQEEADPVVAFWQSKGFSSRAAAGLRQAEVKSLDDMALLSVEQLTEIQGIGAEEVRRCKMLLGGTLRRKADYWTSRGISGRTAGSLVRAGIETLDDLARRTRKEFFLGRGLGEHALCECEALLGRRLASPEDDWLRAGCPQWLLARKLVRARILTVEDLSKKEGRDLAAAGLTRREIEQCNRIVRKAKNKAERA